MKFCFSPNAKGIKGVSFSNSGGGGGGCGGGGNGGAAAVCRRIWSRTLLPAALLLSLLLPFLFVRVAFLVLESSALCNSSFDCIEWKFFGGIDTSMKLKEELTRALVEAKDTDADHNGIGGKTESFDELVKGMTSKRQDIRAFAFQTKAMLSMMEQKVQSARQRESIFWHFASHGIPKSLHCLCLRLAEEYAVNARARSPLPPPEYVHRLTNPSYHHVVLLSNNVLAASVVVSSTVQNSANSEKLVFHIVTDKKTYSPMHAWFAINPIKSAVVQVKGLHQYDWSPEVNAGIREMLEIQHLIWSHYYNSLKEHDFQSKEEHRNNLEALSPGYLSLLNHLRIFVPELFPDLKKIVLLDDDVVVQRDLSSLWELDLDKKVVGAVIDSCGESCCPGRQYKNYLNFSHTDISSNFDPDRCAWLYGLNVIDLEAWRRTNITMNYHQWLRQSLNSGLELWQPGVLPPSLLAFEGHVRPIEPSWHLAGLGYRCPELHKELLESTAVLHFSGPAKPWLEIGSAEVRSLWNRSKRGAQYEIRGKKVLPSVSA